MIHKARTANKPKSREVHHVHLKVYDKTKDEIIRTYPPINVAKADKVTGIGRIIRWATAEGHVVIIYNPHDEEGF